MENQIQQNPNLIKCPHCLGTGMCQRCVRRERDGVYFYECSQCGKGIVARLNEAYSAPVCSICKGTGYNKIG